MALARDHCICLRKTEWSETSQILTLFGRETGVVKVVAKGAHRRTKAGASKFDGGIDTLDIGDAVFTLNIERDLNTLTEWGLRDGNRPLHESLRGMYLGLYAAELVANLIEEHDPHPDLFDRVERALAEFGTEAVEEAFLAFELDLLRHAGVLADFCTCVACGRTAAAVDPRMAFYSPKEGGLVCRACEPGVPDRSRLDTRLVNLAQRLLRPTHGQPHPLPRLTRQQTDPLNRLFASQVEHTVGKRLRMPRHVVGG